MSLTLEKIFEAKNRIAPYTTRTPLIRLEKLDEYLGCQVYLKAECMQITGAFKLRGAVNKIRMLTPEQLSCGIVAASSGNHGKAVAYTAKKLGAKATIVMPYTAPAIKVNAIKELGAEVVQCETSERFDVAERICREKNATMVPPYNDEEIMAGQGTAGIEILEQCPEIDTIIVPVSGGGLIGGKAYSLKEAAQLVKEITYTKFDASLDIDVRLGVDPRKANQMVRGVVSLPHGTGKVVRVLVLCTPDAEAAAKEAGADYVGLDEYIEKIKGGWTDIDVIITMPSIMGKIGALGRVLGPRGLMPNPKSGTVTMDVAKAVREVKQGKIDFKVDKSGIVHTSIGKVSFSAEQIRDNAKEFISTLNKLKPTAAKGTYIKSIYLSSTMSAGIKIDPKTVEEI